jgi:hypothetical protein
MVFCCFPGSGVLLRKGMDIPEGDDLACQSQIWDALPIERGWLS